MAARADRAHAAFRAVRHARPGRGDGDVRPHPAAQRRRRSSSRARRRRCTARRETLFTAEFMGSNNRLPGRVAEVRDGARAARRRRLALVGHARRPAPRRATRRRHDPPRADPHRARARRQPARAPTCRRRCTSATSGSTCSISATRACARTAISRWRPARIGSRCRGRRSGSFERRRQQLTRLTRSSAGRARSPSRLRSPSHNRRPRGASRPTPDRSTARARCACAACGVPSQTITTPACCE